MEARAFDVPKYLAVLPLFNALSPDQLRDVAAGSTLRRLARGEVETYALHSGRQRVIRYLLRDQVVDIHNATEKHTVSLPATKATISSRLSLTPEYFSRVLHELEAQGLIEIDGRDIRILDARRLAEHDEQAHGGAFTPGPVAAACIDAEKPSATRTLPVRAPDPVRHRGSNNEEA